VLEVTYPDNIPAHTKTQKLYFDDAFMLKSWDYETDVLGGVAAHYCYDPATVEGIVFPTLRRVVRRTPDGPLLSGPTSFVLDYTTWRSGREMDDQRSGRTVSALSGETEVARRRRHDRSEGGQLMTSLSGKTALVTGASRGMGRASALALAKVGAQVLVHYNSGVEEAEAVVVEIRKGGGRADAVAADLSAPDGAHKLAKQVRAVVGDRLDILVANAGISKAATIEETTVEDFDRLFAVNVRAPFFLVQQLLPIMCKDSSVVLVSSLAAHAAVGATSVYAATKGAIDTLVKHFAAALGERGIRVNAVAPGAVESDMSNFTKTDAGREFTLSIQALKRIAQPEDIGGVVAFLASNDARWISGDTIRVDGGSKL
jgi:3-oxoacyl-[acyl-carrier protein] reductase